jgi:hypothetical protein
MDGNIPNEQVTTDDKMLMDADEHEDPTTSSYAKFKTQNEIDLENVEKYAPQPPKLDDLDDIVEFGNVV